MSKPVIFCDFDGTVTNNDNIIAIMKKFNPPGWESVKDDILAQRVSIKDGVAKMFTLLPSSKKDDIISYVLEQAQIRDGFSEFVAYAKKQDIALYIVSGGIDFFVYPLLESFGPFAGVYCNEADFSGETININFPHRCDDECTSQGCGCCKPSIIRELLENGAKSIVIGDSITDLEAAKRADLVIARDFLIEKCEELGLSYEPFENFRDVTSIIDARLGVKL
ncbi:2-hydroxy-3-keto-5-methylthiopentenyl-1-phosphate phosphatase [Planococcus shenhongbingii]|uniref:2-hydroxy-3-keto-5-methylthiopentenyl-1- phosphate phosphatase n=1 Tax=Planococcus shenhongbingii TaxID=3058398 RepID=UPI00261CFFBF|nr:2-hydroxy-3-keto-5-methylthiopentenyl-1-phosphate phosphatase [Planococcus sp. N016]WKA58493.1 2-hydroxy-3-keto-5-methylthiopentenyl-1-phosphate phosphatase [Planococcus sp. N016]